MSLPPEKISELKQVIHTHLTNLNIHTQIRNVLNETAQENKENGQGIGNVNTSKESLPNCG